MKVNSTVLGAVLTSVAISCAAGGGSSSGGSGPGNGGTTGQGTGGAPNLTGLGPGGGPSLGVGGGTTGTRDPNDTRNLPVRKKVCADAGVCTCLRVALIGTLTSAANSNNTQAFTDWLNGNSNGTATVTMFSTKAAATLTDAFLSQFDILIVANVNGWSFSGAEKTAVENWVKTSGGGIITLTGFTSTGTEPADTSQLVSFAGMGYTTTQTATQAGQNIDVFYNGVDIPKYCISWSGSSDAIITTPIKFSPEPGNMANLTFSLNYTGGFMGWGVDNPAGSTVVATDPVSNQPMAVALEVADAGRIFSWGDEWVTLTNMWVSSGNPPGNADQYNKCYNMGGGDGGAGFFYGVENLYQTKQFWYDALNWVAPPNECGFTIQDKDVIVLIK